MISRRTVLTGIAAVTAAAAVPAPSVAGPVVLGMDCASGPDFVVVALRTRNEIYAMFGLSPSEIRQSESYYCGRGGIKALDDALARALRPRWPS